ncbi:MAG: UvrD-helicase domain-containing protein [Pseudoramibacter sp.]|jgi:DNA helicase-2/ATP-dependent DNA helicase PcrA
MQCDNLIRVCAAGAGKTYKICHEALHMAKNTHSIIITYTNRGIESVKNELIKANSGVLSDNIDVMTWYSFLLREMIKPYQSELFEINQLCGLNFRLMHKRNYQKKENPLRYVDSKFNVRAEQASALAIELNIRTQGAVINRLARIYDHIFIDEVQDMAGYDLDLIRLLIVSKIPITIVGDEKQAIFQTHYSRKNANKSGKNVWKFFSSLKNKGLVVVEKNLYSRRFNERICNFANSIYSDANNISTCMKEKTKHDGVFLVLKKDVNQYYQRFHPVVLRYDVKTNTMEYRAYNFGECKGLTFDRVLIFPNKAFLNFVLKNQKLKSPTKYYVAATRAKYSIAIVINNINSIRRYKEKVLLGEISVYRIY